jgi:hypothetical protein
MPRGIHINTESRTLLYHLFTVNQWTVNQVFNIIYANNELNMSRGHLKNLRTMFLHSSNDEISTYISAIAKRGRVAAPIDSLVDTLVDGFVAIYPCRQVDFIRHLVNSAMNEHYGHISKETIK